MAIREFMGLDIPAFKRFYKDSKKNNVQQFMKTVSCKRFTIS